MDTGKNEKEFEENLKKLIRSMADAKGVPSRIHIFKGHELYEILDKINDQELIEEPVLKEGPI
jgi:hypothetical protein